MSPRAASALLAAGLVACGVLPRGPADYEARPGPYDRLEQVLPAEVREVQRLRDEGRLDTAVAWVRRLAAREPAHLPLACLRQDVELEANRGQVPEELLAAARARLESTPDDPVAALLAARLEPHPGRARTLLGHALDLAPDSAWTHYSLAHAEARQGRWGSAAERLDRALLIDPGHLWARRLQTQLLARSGPGDEAVDQLERWLAAAARSPFFRRGELDAARLDLAHQLLLEGRPEEAALALEPLGDRARASARALQLSAAVHQAEEQPALAQEAALRAQTADPADPLSQVQQAMLAEEWLGAPEQARQHWKAVLELTSARADLASLLLSLRARAALERLAGAAPEEPGREGPRP